jgi:hypothetical protein
MKINIGRHNKTDKIIGKNLKNLSDLLIFIVVDVENTKALNQFKLYTKDKKVKIQNT